MESSTVTPLLIVPLKALFSITWLIFLVVGAVPLQQLRQVNKVIQTPFDKLGWLIYLLYVIFAVVVFVIGMSALWLI
jgi:hypothetical protein